MVQQSLFKKILRGKRGRKQAKALLQKRQALENDSAIKIQKAFRGRQARLETEVLRNRQNIEQEMAILIQKRIRGIWGRVLVEALRHQKALEDFSACQIQKVFRGVQGRRLVQEQQNEKERLLELEKQNEAARIIQNAIRDRRVKPAASIEFEETELFSEDDEVLMVEDFSALSTFTDRTVIALVVGLGITLALAVACVDGGLTLKTATVAKANTDTSLSVLLSSASEKLAHNQVEWFGVAVVAIAQFIYG